MADYQIQPGDTLSKIAKMYGTTVKQLQKMNGIKNANLIFAGSTLKVPDLESEDAFQLPGLTVEQQNPKCGKKTGKAPDIPSDVRTVYSIQVPRDGKGSEWRPPLLPPEEDKPKLPKMPWNPKDPSDKEPDKPGVRLVYAYIPPKDGKEPKPVPMYAYIPPRDGKEPKPEPMYAYIPPKDEKPGVQPEYAIQVPPGGDEPGKIVPMYGITCPPGGDEPVLPKMPWTPDDPTRPTDPEKPPIKTVYAVLTPPMGGDLPVKPVKPGKPQKPQPPQDPSDPIIIRVPEKPGRGRRIIIDIPGDPPGNVDGPEKPVKRPPKKKITKPADDVGDKPPVEKPPKKKPTKPKPPTDFSD